MNKLTIISGILIIITIGFLTFVGIKSSNKTKEYKNLENNIVTAMKTYYGQDSNLKKLPANNKTHKVTITELKEFGIEINNVINEDTCEGYGIVTGESLSHSYKAYIKCNNYTTKNYKN